MPESQPVWNPPVAEESKIQKRRLQKQSLPESKLKRCHLQQRQARPANRYRLACAKLPQPDAGRPSILPSLSASDPISAHALVLVLQQLKPIGKPLRWMGQRLHHTNWEAIIQAAPSTEFVKLAACLQLADRNGPVTQRRSGCILQHGTGRRSQSLCRNRMPGQAGCIGAAADLDQFCADVDVLIGFNIISKDGSPFAGTKLRGLAESAGMKLMPDGSFHFLNDDGAQLFSLGNLESAPFSADAMKHACHAWRDLPVRRAQGGGWSAGIQPDAAGSAPVCRAAGCPDGG